MDNDHQLKEDTVRLAEAAEDLIRTFHQVKTTGEAKDFYEVVHPYANKVKQLNDEWKELALKWVNDKRPVYLNGAQILSASDHIEIISIQAFYPETSKKRFLDAAKSIQYILQALLNELNKGGKTGEQ
ncbi:YppE family protein [Niallia sp. 03190]|uniref:YppE family protein n=1 Tax=Niallia sp. 03190 TaxID=3458061 RepID=UPI0040446A1F